MPTYVIVSSIKASLAPNEIRAGETIDVEPGDVFLVDPSADAEINFASAQGGPAHFTVQIAQSNDHSVRLFIGEDLSGTVLIADGVMADDLSIDAKFAAGLDFVAGNDVTFGKLTGSDDGDNRIVIGNGFSTDKKWTLGDGNDSMLVGNDARFEDIVTDKGDDTVTFGDGLDADRIKTGNDDDTIIIGSGAQVRDLDSGRGVDQVESETEGLGPAGATEASVTLPSWVQDILSSSGDLLPASVTQRLEMTDDADIFDGSDEDELVELHGGDDMSSGEGGSDMIIGGGGNDTIYGDAGDGTGFSVECSPLTLDINNVESKSYRSRFAEEEDHVIYRDVGTLEDGSPVYGRLVLVGKSDPNMRVDLAGGRGFEILMYGNGTGDTAQFRFEFFDPETGDPIALNGVATFNDLDANRFPSDVEAVSLSKESFTTYSTSNETSLSVTETESSVRASGTEANSPDDQDAWFSAAFEDRTFLEFTLEARTTGSGFTFSGDLISDPLTTVIEQGNDSLCGGEGDDLIYGQGGDDELLGGEGNDTLSGGAENDTLSGGAGEDNLLGGTGDDIVEGGIGDDTISGGDGADTLSGGAGDDYIEGGEGDDRLSTGIGDDTLDGGEGDDTLTNSSGDDSLVGGAGNDSIIASAGNDTLEGGDGNDTLVGGIHDDSLSGGAGDDLILADFETDGLVEDNTAFSYEYYALDGERSVTTLSDAGFTSGTENDNPPDGEGAVGSINPAQIDNFHGGSDDTYAVKLTTTLTISEKGAYKIGLSSNGSAKIYVDGVELASSDAALSSSSGSGAVELSGGDHLIEILYLEQGSDNGLQVLIAGPDTGNRAISLEDANVSSSFDDRIDGGAGDDTITGGLGDDVFLYRAGDGDDTITDFNTGNSGALDDGDRSNNDFINLSAFYDNIRELHADQADDGVLNQSNATTARGDAVDYSDNAQFGRGSLTFEGARADSSFFTADNTGVVCFALGTLIETPKGPVPVERLQCGDAVSTCDHGPQPVVWTVTRHLDRAALERDPSLRPIRVSPQVAGGFAPLELSPQHGVLLRVNGEEVFVRAVHLDRMRGGQARRCMGRKSVTYVNFMLPRHEVVFANGTPVESFYPGINGIRTLSPDARETLAGALDALRQKGGAVGYGPTARPFMRWRDLPDHLRALDSA
ncbi:Hint domain-containing protein [Cognatishimia sp. F0-27]|uniref:Hint domain-containing protein n=1 Tax=Cognatishimia sp. F0-27 TaxID=2816855 RepID=UPI001D0C3A36|nr:Hint domain-containing protein [Cognatishimia sp. F0-27]MCC1493184.1 Hint domain-containing protein [Cognatishimia sp. F0-27]